MADQTAATVRQLFARRGPALLLSAGLGLALAVLLLAGLRPVAAAGPAAPATVYACSETGLNSALAAGGSASFSCSVPTTVTVSTTKNVVRGATLDGGQNLILSGGGISAVFSVGVGIQLNLLNLTLRDSPGAIINYGRLGVTHAQFISNTAYSVYNNPGAAATISGTTFTGGYSKGGVLFNGGFLVTQTASLNVINSVFHNNLGGFGAAIYNDSGPVAITGSTFYENHAFQGGAIFNLSQLSVNSSRFYLDTATSSLITAQARLAGPPAGPAGPAGISTFVGGAIYSGPGADLVVSGSTFTQNLSTQGGGAIFAGDFPVGLPVTPTAHSFAVTESTFGDNCTSGPGGALFAGQLASVSGSAFTGNFADPTGAVCVFPPAAHSSASGSAAPARASAPLSLSPVIQNGAGGAIYSDFNLAVDSSQFLSNSASYTSTGGGGAIWDYFSGSLQVSGSTFAGNTALHDGGAVFSELDTVAAFDATDFRNNAAADSGGAISSEGALTVTNSTFTGDQSGEVRNVLGGGGAIYDGGPFVVSGPAAPNGQVAAADPLARQAPGVLFIPTRLFIDHTRFISNSSAGEGGALDARAMLINASTFTSNTSAYGGAIDALNSPVTVTASTFMFNAAVTTTLYGPAQGGAIDANASPLAIVNSTFYQNRARGGAIGGAINADSSATVAVTNTTFLSNSADLPGSGGTFARAAGASVVLHNVLLASSAGNDCTRTLTLVGANLEFPDNSCGVASVTGNPLALPPANNGGPTLTSALLPLSPAINAGDNAGCPSTDQRGAHRPVGPRCDIGAYEFGAQLPVLWLPLIRR